jgi:MYXO-CTERM domain-containing protein
MRFLRFWGVTAMVMASVTAGGLVACASSDDGAEDGSQDLTGGQTSVDAPVAYFYADKNTSSTKCVGALIADRIVVTAKNCAATGMFVGQAHGDGTAIRAQVTAVHVPDGADADIAVVEINRALKGTPHAVITHAPLRDGYTIDSVSSTNGDFFAPKKGQPASVNGRLISETDTFSIVVPDKGSQLCAGDLGAPVCSSASSTNDDGMQLSGTCGLAGIVIGTDTMIANANPLDAGAPSSVDDTGARCSAGQWKVAQLGRHAAFIKQFAPQAFQPIEVSEFFGFETSEVVPDGLWGFKTGGDVKACQITTTTLPPAAINAQVKLSAKVSFANMQEHAAPFGRFGLALKATPTQIQWLPAKSDGAGSGRSFDATFDGTISAASDGDYVVAFRASANGGETWTECDTDGIGNGFSQDKVLSVKIGAGGTGTTSPTTPTTLPDGGTAPPVTAPPTTTTPPADQSDPNASSDNSSGGDNSGTGDDADAGDKAPAKKKKAGCAVSTGPSSPLGGEPALPALGLALGLAALARRRRTPRA